MLSPRGRARPARAWARPAAAGAAGLRRVDGRQDPRRDGRASIASERGPFARHAGVAPILASSGRRQPTDSITAATASLDVGRAPLAACRPPLGIPDQQLPQRAERPQAAGHPPQGIEGLLGEHERAGVGARIAEAADHNEAAPTLTVTHRTRSAPRTVLRSPRAASANPLTAEQSAPRRGGGGTRPNRDQGAGSGTLPISFPAEAICAYA